MTTERKESLIFFGVLSAFLTLGSFSYFAGVLISEKYDIPPLRFFADIGLTATLCLYGILACMTAAILLGRRFDTV